MSNFAVDSFAMPAVSASGVKHEEGVFWLLDSGSSYHVISRETLDCGHVKVLSRRQKPRTVCQTATGDLVEVGSDMHATVEVSFLTTHPISANGGHRQDVLSNYACTCRLEAVVSDQIKHNLINLNLLCWKGWKPTLHKGLLTAEQQGVVLLPHLYGDCTWLESVAPEHPSALYAGELMSSVVGQSVGRSVAGLVGRPEKRVSFQSDSDVPKEEEVFPESFQDLQPQHVFGRHVHDHDVWLSCCKYKSLFSTENFRIFMMRKFRLSVLGKLYKSWERIFLVAIRATELFCSGQGAMAEAPNLEGILAPLLLRVARLEAHVTTMDLPFVEDRLDNMETVVAALGREFDALAQRLEELQRQIRRLEAAVCSLERERRSINDLADRISNLEIASGQETQRALEYHQIVLQELDHRVASLESPAHPDNP